MSDLLGRMSAWLVAPREDAPVAPGEDEREYGGTKPESPRWLPPAPPPPPGAIDRGPPLGASTCVVSGPASAIEPSSALATNGPPEMGQGSAAAPGRARTNAASPGDATVDARAVALSSADATGDAAAIAVSSGDATGGGDGVPISRIAVIGESDVVPALAAGLALGLRRRRRRASALVLVWSGDVAPGADPHPEGEMRSAAASSPGDAAPGVGVSSAPDGSATYAPAGVPVLPGAKLLAARLARRGLAVRAGGRLVWVPLGAGSGRDAAGYGMAPLEKAVRHVEAAAGHVPSVLAVTAPRGTDVDALLLDRDLVVVAAEPHSPLALVAIAELAAIGASARAVAPPPPGLARAAMLAGWRAHSLEAEESPREEAIA